MCNKSNSPFIDTSVSLTLVILFIVGIHTRYTLYLSPRMYIPYIFSGIAGILLLGKNAKKIKIRHIIPIFGIIGVASITIIFAPHFVRYFLERFKALIYLTYSIVIGYALYLEIASWKRKMIVKFLLSATFIILIGSILENFTFIKEVSDYFRLNALHHAYSADFRDLNLHGGVRPKFFTAEPSMLAATYVLLSTSWLILSKSKIRYIVYFAMLILMIMASRSPVLFIGITNACAIFLFSRISSQKINLKLVVKRGLSFLMIIIIGLGIIYLASTRIISGRYEAVVRGEDESLIIRTVVPLVISYSTLSQYPFFGAGIGGKEAIEEITLEVLLSHNIAIKRLVAGVGVSHTIASAFFEYWIVFGILGGTIGVFLIANLAKRLGCKDTFTFLIIIVSYSLVQGAVGGTWIWSSIFITIIALEHANRTCGWFGKRKRRCFFSEYNLRDNLYDGGKNAQI